MNTKLELLAPAKNAEQGKAAINCGADAVYIGAPAFGARVAAGNSIEDIEELVRYAHLFGSKVFATVNTLVFDNELADAEKLLWQLYNAGVDAAIIQDLGLLEMNLPPIELHASTQTHNIEPQRIKFLEQVGFKRIILARETSLEQMRTLRKETHADLEAFVQGALCVCYSGQCYMSLYLTGRSGNRGSCSQPCRSSYDLINGDGKLLKHDEHLLSLKDFSAAHHIENMIDAGITSFKIEGRLKDISYVKNVTAYYRKLIDTIIERKNNGTDRAHQYRKASSGSTIVNFEPDLERTFNRGFTDYFLVGRQPMASRTTQKSLGKEIGKVVAVYGNRLTIKTKHTLAAGDGICYFNEKGQLEGFLVNHVVSTTQITTNKNVDAPIGTTLWRNNDYLFEKMLQGECSQRKIAVHMTLSETPTGLQLTIVDEDGCNASASVECEKTEARDKEKARDTIVKQLAKLGGTPFALEKSTMEISNNYFIPTSTLNALRRNAIERLEQARAAHFHPKDSTFVTNDTPYFTTELDGRGNVVNNKAEDFYRRHGVTLIERGPDQPGKKMAANFPLMTTKYCLRYELGQCLMNKGNTKRDKAFGKELKLINNGKHFQLHFDCKRCEMQLFADE